MGNVLFYAIQALRILEMNVIARTQDRIDIEFDEAVIQELGYPHECPC